MKMLFKPAAAFAWALLALASPGAFLLPDSASGTFVQTKVLADAGLSLESSGTWQFEKGRKIVYHTLKPVESVFSATPTNFSWSAAGKTFGRPFKSDISSFERIFEIREVKDAVSSIETEGTNFPYRIKVKYHNGDRLDVELRR